MGEVILGGKVVLAHVPSSGRMRELLYPGANIYVSRMKGSGKKTACRILLARHKGILVSVDSLLPNRLLRRALLAGCLEEFSGYSAVRPEVRFGNSRIDFLLSGSVGQCYLEVKSVTLAVEGTAFFPDAPSERGVKHLDELAKARGEGMRAAVMFVIQRQDAISFKPNDATDPAFGEALRRAAAAGVEVFARKCKVSRTWVALGEAISVGSMI